MGITYRGLEVYEPEVTTAEEFAAFRDFGDQPTGRPLASYALWADLRPDVLKRLLAYVRQIHESEAFSFPLPYMNLYAVGGWSEGVSYIMRICQPSFMTGVGYSRDAVLETLALSFYLAPTWGTVITADAMRDSLAEFKEPEPGSPSPYPQGWAIEPEKLKAGLDYSSPEMSKEDLTALREWYLRVCGEVPKTIEIYAKYRPNLLKAERNRWENIVREGLPNQMFAYLLLHYEVWRGNVAGTRDALLLARGLGMEKEHAVDAVFYGGCFLGGTGTIAAVAEPIEEVPRELVAAMPEAATIAGLPTVVREYFEALNAEDFEALEGTWSADAELRAVGSRPRRGVDAVMAYFRPLFGLWASYLDQPTRVIGSGDVVVVEVTFNGRTEAGKELAFDAVDVFDLAVERIVRLTSWYDLAWLRSQL